MTFEKINEAINLLKQQKIFYECSGPKPLKLIDEAENILNCKLSKSYRYFLEKLGNFSFKGFYIFGLLSNEISDLSNTGFVCGVLNDRKRFQRPNHLITLEEIGDGSDYTLDLSQMNSYNECPVVVWPIGGYEMTPVLEIVAPDFGTWFLEEVKERIKWQQEG